MTTEITVPTDRPVTMGVVRMPTETPIGIMDGSVIECLFDGRRFHLLDQSGEAIDVDSGEVVRLVVPPDFWPL